MAAAGRVCSTAEPYQQFAMFAAHPPLMGGVLRFERWTRKD
jgi:hypothetical protein